MGQRLKEARDRRMLSQSELAALAEVSVMTVSRIERGIEQRPYQRTLRALAKALDIDPMWLRDGEEPRPARPDPEDTP